MIRKLAQDLEHYIIRTGNAMVNNLYTFVEKAGIPDVIAGVVQQVIGNISGMIPQIANQIISQILGGVVKKGK